MTIKTLKKFAEFLHRSEGISLTPIIVIMVVMSVMGGVFTSIMGGWKVSAPLTVNSSKAFFQAEMAAMFALQDAQYRFYSKDTSSNDLFNVGTSTTEPYIVSSVTTGNVTEVADYWFEMPNASDDVTTGTNDDTLPDDDDDDSSDPTRYSIIATGRIEIGGTTLAKRQIKILADIIPNTIQSGVHTSSDINGTAGVGFGMNNSTSGAFVNYDDVAPNNVAFGSESAPPIVYRPSPTQPDKVLFEDIVRALATDQGHFNAGNLTINAGNDDYPDPAATNKYYYDSPATTMPNITYVGGNLTVAAGFKAHGVIWVGGNVFLDNTGTMNTIIICEGNITFFGVPSNINGGIIHYGGGTITGNANANAITVNNAYFIALNAAIPDITVASWQEAVSAN